MREEKSVCSYGLERKRRDRLLISQGGKGEEHVLHWRGRSRHELDGKEGGKEKAIACRCPQKKRRTGDRGSNVDSGQPETRLGCCARGGEEKKEPSAEGGGGETLISTSAMILEKGEWGGRGGLLGHRKGKRKKKEKRGRPTSGLDRKEQDLDQA